MSIYSVLWKAIGKRPWTYIYRDVWHKYEWFPQFQWFFTGLVVYHFGGWLGVWAFLGFYTYGYINGHFFWGRRYIPNQQGEDKDGA